MNESINQSINQSFKYKKLNTQKLVLLIAIITHFSQGTVATKNFVDVQQYSDWGRGYITKKCSSIPSLHGMKIGIIFYLSHL
jgi:hypothetical protein